MKKTLIIIITVFPYLLFAQPKIKDRKYQGLLWEISGNGIKKPSYLFGTMHVSNKLAFQLADSFYLGIRNADVVALETNPESWQEDMSKYKDQEGDDDDMSGFRYRRSSYISVPDDYLSMNTLKFYKYDKKIERALYSNPSTINNLLYRTYGNASSDFEEDTYLDMYIYQCGKKWGKKVAGVERYAESMKLMAEAYKDAAKDKNKKERSYDRDEGYSPDKIQEAYRAGNLDLLDSINKYNSFSAAFDEKFLYKRNEIQASSIDSILRTSLSLFVGVGAAHLPGTRGVIELLRKMGYQLRPIKMGERDSQHKSSVEKLRVPVAFSTQAADDGLFRVDIPGKFYKFGDDVSLDQRQYADMANGAYYMVTRVMTNAWMWGHSMTDVYKIVDSLLYENIPGKIVTKTNIIRNGYKGFAITNKTRRGDVQRYNIFITPFEIIFFKMSGTGDYVKNGDEADRFFNSIQFREPKASEWKKYSPSCGGFSAELPQEPYVGNDGSWIYDAEDRSANAHYRIVRSDIHNYNFVEEDTFDLNLMDESFQASDFIDTQVSRKQVVYKGYPALDCKYLDKKKSVYLVRFIIQGPHYYTLVAYGTQETARMKSFLNSFELRPFVYDVAKDRKDTSLYFSVKSPVFPDQKKDPVSVSRFGLFGGDNDDDESDAAQLESGAFRSKVISNDTTGEKIYVSFYKAQRYFMASDSSLLDDDDDNALMGDTTLIVRMKKKYELPNKMKVTERIISDTGSSRAIWVKSFYKDGIGFLLMTECDTLTKPSAFVQSFYDSFVPADTLKGINPFTKKSSLFFADLASSDSVAHKRAIKNIYQVRVDSTDFTSLKKAIASVSWNEKKYLDTKKSLIAKLDDIPTKQSSDYLKELYYAAGDTIELQYVALETLLQQKTPYAFSVFRDIITVEPPVLDVRSGNKYRDYVPDGYNPRKKTRSLYGKNSYSYNNGSFLDELYDSLALTKTILADLLPLLNIDDYEPAMMKLLGQMVDSNLAKPKDYQIYFSKFLIEAKQELKKQAIAEKNKAIKKAESARDDKKSLYGEEEDKDYGNDDLELYATLLLPYAESNPNVQPLVQQMLASNDKELKYNIMILLLRNNKPVPDSVLKNFASLDGYRYQLYEDLKDINRSNKFPAFYNNHLDLGRSKLLEEKLYGKPDSVVYIDRLPAEMKNRKGFVYFFKYKTKKDDVDWKLATVGLVPADPKVFEFENPDNPDFSEYSPSYKRGNYYKYDLTGFSDTKIKDDEPVADQLKKMLKRMLYSKRKSAREFYSRDDSGYDVSSRVDFGE